MDTLSTSRKHTTIDALPYDILFAIFERAACMDDFHMSQWKRLLGLLAVCSRWRHIAVEIVYRYLAITYGDSEWPFAEVTEDTQADEPKWEDLKTNLDVVEHLGLSHLVKQLDLTIYHFTNPIIGLKTIMSRLKQVATVWPHVKVLNITTECNPELYELVGRNIDQLKASITELVDDMQVVLPNVNTLLSWSNSENSLVRRLIGELAERYTLQMTRISANHQLQTWNPQSFAKLKHLKVNMEHMAACHYSTVLPDSLVSLCMRDIQPNSEWNIFGNKQYLEFTNLKTLDIRYSFLENSSDLVTRSDAHKKKVHFPQLQNLLLFGSSINSPVLRQSVFPKKIKYLEIRSHKNVIDAAANVNLPKAESLSMSLNYSQYNQHINILSSINKLAELADNVVDASLNIAAPINLDSFGNTTCSFITYLRVGSSISAKLAIKLIQACPQMAKLCLYKLDVEASEDFTKYCLENANNTVKPLHLNIQDATIQFMHTSDSSSNAVDFVKYLLIRIPALHSLMFSGIPSTPIAEFKDMYSAAYPHLQNITISSYNSATVF